SSKWWLRRQGKWNRDRLFVLDAPERQVDAWLNHARFFWNLVLEVFLSIASHDKQAAMRQPPRKCYGSVLSLEPEHALHAQTDRGDNRPHFRFSVSM